MSFILIIRKNTTLAGIVKIMAMNNLICNNKHLTQDIKKFLLAKGKKKRRSIVIHKLRCNKLLLTNTECRIDGYKQLGAQVEDIKTNQDIQHAKK